MPPKAKTAAKAKAQKAQDKAKVEQKKKVLEDKTFGLKNKNKSAKVQKYIQNQYTTLEKNVKGKQPAEDNKKEKKKLEAERQKELDDLFKVAIKQPKVPVGVDPKSVLCELFKHGCCTKGFKCKFSHDLEIGRKAAKIDLYTDRRDEEENMEDWDQEKLEQVVEQKHGVENKKSNKTTIVCKFFLEAVERKKYGWFWKCPNGNECIYRHCLPPGYVLKSQIAELLEEETQKEDVSEAIEAERQKVDAITRITEEVFKEWHAQKVKTKEEIKQKKAAERIQKGILNGREIFLQQGFVATDDASASMSYAREVDTEEEIKQMEEDAKKQMEDAKKQALEVPTTHLDLDKLDEELFLDDDDDDLDPAELDRLEDELESSLKIVGN
eukprot:g478.t1